MAGLLYSASLCYLAATATLMVVFVAGHPNGAPKTACATMTPFPLSHKANGEQDSPCPFQVVPDKKEMTNGDTVTVQLSVKPDNNNNKKSGATFKGYILLAFDSKENATAIGSFTVDKDVGKTLDCSFGSKSAVTHVNNSTKTAVSAVWKPPSGYSGDVYFRASFVQTLSVYWVRESSSVFKVLPAKQ